MSGFRVRFGDDSGIALLSVILVMAVLVGLGSTVTFVAVHNMRNAVSDKEALGAQAIAEGGLAQAVEYIRSNGVGELTCPEALGEVLDPSCTSLTNPWANPDPAQSQVVTQDSQSFRIWIGLVSAATPPTVKTSTYRIHSTGLSNPAPGSRQLTLDIAVKPFEFPIGVYAETATGGGSAGVHHESLFTQDCVFDRSHTTFEGVDYYYDIPAAAHSTRYVTDSQNSCQSKNTGSNSKNIHATGVCNTSYGYDQDAEGGDLTSTACYGTYTKADGTLYPTTSKFTLSDLKTVGYKAGGLTTAQYAALKARAQSMGTYYTTPTPTPRTLSDGTSSFFPDPAIYPQGVLYFDLKNNETIDIQGSDIPSAYSRAVNDGPDCVRDSVIIVVRNGSLKVNSNVVLTAAIFVPENTYSGEGGAQIIGTLFAFKVDKLNGTQDFHLDKCFLDNLPGGLLEIDTTRYHEVDR